MEDRKMGSHGSEVEFVPINLSFSCLPFSCQISPVELTGKMEDRKMGSHGSEVEFVPQSLDGFVQIYRFCGSHNSIFRGLTHERQTERQWK